MFEEVFSGIKLVDLKLISHDGIYEAVYNEAGQLCTEYNDPTHMGTYNYANPDGSLVEMTDHGWHDVYPYTNNFVSALLPFFPNDVIGLGYGNAPNDTIPNISPATNKDRYNNSTDLTARRAREYRADFIIKWTGRVQN